MTRETALNQELNAIRGMMRGYVPGTPYPKAFRDRVARLVTVWGLNRRETARALGIGAPTVATFIAELQGLKAAPTKLTPSPPTPRTSAVISAERERHQREIAERLRERDERLRNRPAYCFNIDLLGDPPPGRSALDQRKSA